MKIFKSQVSNIYLFLNYGDKIGNAKSLKKQINTKVEEGNKIHKSFRWIYLLFSTFRVFIFAIFLFTSRYSIDK